MKVYNVGKRTYTIANGTEIKPGIATEVPDSVGKRLMAAYPKDLKTMEDAKSARKSRREHELDRREAEIVAREKALADKSKGKPKKEGD